MDNETSAEIQEFIRGRKVDVQFAPPEMHRQNAAERGVRTWKNHFIASLASLPADFPIANWCRLIPQTNLTLNLMRPCRQNQALSAHAALYGDFHFESTPMAPPGTKCLAHAKPSTRNTFGHHAKDAHFVGPAMKHWRCYTIVSTHTGAQSVTDTVKFQHHVVTVPNVTPADRIIEATRALSRALKNMPPEAPPHQLDAIQRLRTVLQEQPQQSAASEGAENAGPIRTSEGAQQSISSPSEGAQTVPPPNPHLPFITQDDDDANDAQADPNDSFEPPLAPRYNL